MAFIWISYVGVFPLPGSNIWPLVSGLVSEVFFFFFFKGSTVSAESVRRESVTEAVSETFSLFLKETLSFTVIFFSLYTESEGFWLWEPAAVEPVGSGL